MAIETYTNAKAVLVNSSDTELYTAPVTKSSVVHAIFFANLLNTDLYISTSVESNGIKYIIGNNIKVRKNSSLSWDKPVNLKPNEKILVSSSNSLGNVSVFASILELEFGV